MISKSTPTFHVGNLRPTPANTDVGAVFIASVSDEVRGSNVGKPMSFCACRLSGLFIHKHEKTNAKRIMFRWRIFNGMRWKSTEFLSEKDNTVLF